MKKLLLLALALVLVTGGAAFLMNKKRADAARACIASLPGDVRAGSVKADFFGNGLEIHNLTGALTYLEGSPMTVKIDRLRLEGVNAKAVQTQGQAKLADVIILNGFSLSFPQDSPGPMGCESYILGEARMEGLWADCAALAAASGSAADSDKMATALLSLRFGKSVSKDSEFSVNMGPMPAELGFDDGDIRYTGRAAYAEAEANTLTDMGRVLLRGLSLEFSGGTKAAMAEMTVGAGKIPSRAYRLGLMDPQTPLPPNPEDFLALFAEEGYLLEDVKAQKLEITLPKGGVIQAAEAGCDLVFSDRELRAALRAEQAQVPGSLLSGLSDTPEMYESVLGNRTFVFSGSHELRLTANDNGRVDMSYREETREKDLGSLSDEIVLSAPHGQGPLKALPDNFMAVTLHKAGLRLEDTGMLDLFFELLGAALGHYSGGSVSARDAGVLLRAQQVAELEALPLNEGGALAGLRDAAAALLRQPGVLTVSCEPEQPLPVLPLIVNPMALDKLPLKSDFTPGQSGR